MRNTEGVKDPSSTLVRKHSSMKSRQTRRLDQLRPRGKDTLELTEYLYQLHPFEIEPKVEEREEESLYPPGCPEKRKAKYLAVIVRKPKQM